MGFGFSLGRLLNFFSLQGDNFIVGRVLGTEALGLYNRAYQLMTLPAMYVGQVFERVMFPAMARRQSDKHRVGAEFLMALEAITLVALPAGVVMFILGREIILVIFGERWIGIVPVFSVLSFGVFFRTAYKCSDTVVRSLGAVFHYAGRQALYAALVIGGAWCGAILSGVPGVAWGVVGAVAINYVSMTRLSTRLLGISVHKVVRAHFVGLWSSAAVALVLSVVSDSLRANSAHPFIVLIEAGLISGVVWILSLLCATLVVPFGCMRRVRDYLVARVHLANRYSPDNP
jgi:PST family polysaccharide transporter